MELQELPEGKRHRRACAQSAPEVLEKIKTVEPGHQRPLDAAMTSSGEGGQGGEGGHAGEGGQGCEGGKGGKGGKEANAARVARVTGAPRSAELQRPLQGHQQLNAQIVREWERLFAPMLQQVQQELQQEKQQQLQKAAQEEEKGEQQQPQQQVQQQLQQEKQQQFKFGRMVPTDEDIIEEEKEDEEEQLPCGIGGRRSSRSPSSSDAETLLMGGREGCDEIRARDADAAAA